MKSHHGHWGKFSDCLHQTQQSIAKIDPVFHSLYGAGIASLRKSERFYVPDGADILQKKEISPLKPFLKSPYDVVSILHEVHINDVPSQNAIWCISVGVRIPDDGGERILLFSFVQPPTGIWAMCPYSCVLILNDGPGFNLFLADDPATTQMLKIGRTVNQLTGDFLEDAQAWMNLCLLLNVHNTARVSIDPPERLNKARVKSGKQPLQSYHVLEIGGDRWDSPYVNVGTGSGKRSHLRRGHVRHLGGDRLTWIRDTVVKGSRAGFVHKDYAAKIVDGA